MKKLILTIATLGVVLGTAFAQADSVAYERSLRYPSAGSFGVGIEASPILNFVGNMFNGSTNNNPSNYWGKQDYTVYMRYFLLDNLALRGRVRFSPGGVLSTTVRRVRDDAAAIKDPLSNAAVEDRMTQFTNDWMVSAGAQLFRGRDRLRGFFGGDIFYQYTRSSKKYEYGNVMNAANTAPSYYDFANNTAATGSSRALEENGGPMNRVGLNGFTGVEYYFLRQMCVGFEVGVHFSAQFVGRGSSKNEKVENGVRKEYVVSTNEGGTPAGNDEWSNGYKISFSTVTPFYGNFYLVFHF